MSVDAAVAAITRGDVEELGRLLGANPATGKSWKPIMQAALLGRPDCARLLLETGADPNALSAGADRFRPLHRAIEHRGVKREPGHRQVVELLLAAGADPNARACWQAMDALQTAARVDDPEMIELLEPHFPALDLCTAAILGRPEHTQGLLAADPSAARQVAANGMTPLHFAAASGLGNADAQRAAELKRVAELLLEAGADPNAVTLGGRYPGLPVAHFAAPRNRGVVEALLAHGLETRRALGSFLWSDFREVAQLLLEHGGDVNAVDDRGTPLLHERIHWGHTGAALWLLERGADPNQRDAEGWTAAHHAADRGISPAFLDELARRGAEFAAVDGKGRSVREIAERKKRTKLLAWLDARPKE